MIVIFNGPPGSGKDEAAKLFSNRGFRHLSFKEELFKETVKLFDVDMDWFMSGYNDRSVKERKEDRLKGMSRREAMIYTSEDVIKPKYGKSYFGEQVCKRIEEHVNYAVSDGGFVEEIVPLIRNTINNNIVIVQLTRKNCSYSADSRRYFNGTLIKEYISGDYTPIEEEYVQPEKLPLPAFRIHNNGTLEEFHKILDDLMYIDILTDVRKNFEKTTGYANTEYRQSA